MSSTTRSGTEAASIPAASCTSTNLASLLERQSATLRFSLSWRPLFRRPATTGARLNLKERALALGERLKEERKVRVRAGERNRSILEPSAAAIQSASVKSRIGREGGTLVERDVRLWGQFA